jgi:hypothetical protein
MKKSSCLILSSLLLAAGIAHAASSNGVITGLTLSTMSPVVGQEIVLTVAATVQDGKGCHLAGGAAGKFVDFGVHTSFPADMPVTVKFDQAGDYYIHAYAGTTDKDNLCTGTSKIQVHVAAVSVPVENPSEVKITSVAVTPLVTLVATPTGPKASVTMGPLFSGKMTDCVVAVAWGDGTPGIAKTHIYNYENISPMRYVHDYVLPSTGAGYVASVSAVSGCKGSERQYIKVLAGEGTSVPTTPATPTKPSTPSPCTPPTVAKNGTCVTPAKSR